MAGLPATMQQNHGGRFERPTNIANKCQPIRIAIVPQRQINHPGGLATAWDQVNRWPQIGRSFA